MSTRRRLALGAGLLLVAIGIASLLQFRRASPISRQSFELIQVGMSVDQVQAVFGLPPGRYATGVVEPYPSIGDVQKADVESGVRVVENLALLSTLQATGGLEWVGDYGYAVVTLDQNGKVEQMAYTDMRPVADSFLDRLLRRLGVR